MAGNQGLFQALKMLKEGSRDLATGIAVNNAQKQVDEIRTSITDEGKRRQALMQTSNDLALRLAGMGASGTQINAAFQAISPQQFGSPEQAQLFGKVNSNEFVEQAGKELIDEREQRLAKRDDRKLSFALRKQQAQQSSSLSKEMRANIKDRQKEFNRLTSKVFESMNQINAGAGTLDAANPVGDQAIRILLAKGSGEVGNLTKAEQDMFAGSPALIDEAKRLLSFKGAGRLPDSDRASLKELINIYRENGRRAIEARANLVSSQVSQNLGIDLEKAKDYILPPSVRDNVFKSPNKERSSDSFMDIPDSTQAPAATAPTPTKPSASKYLRGR